MISQGKPELWAPPFHRGMCRLRGWFMQRLNLSNSLLRDDFPSREAVPALESQPAVLLGSRLTFQSVLLVVFQWVAAVHCFRNSMKILTNSKDNMTAFSWFRGFYFSQNYNLFPNFLPLFSPEKRLQSWEPCCPAGGLWLGLWSLPMKVWWHCPSLIILFTMATVAVKFEMQWPLM